MIRFIFLFFFLLKEDELQTMMITWWNVHVFQQIERKSSEPLEPPAACEANYLTSRLLTPNRPHRSLCASWVAFKLKEAELRGCKHKFPLMCHHHCVGQKGTWSHSIKGFLLEMSYRMWPCIAPLSGKKQNKSSYQFHITVKIQQYGIKTNYEGNDSLFPAY